MSPASDLPPEIEHITVGYQPVSTLISRLCQGTFNDLRDVINAMAEMPVAPPRNGVTSGHHHIAVNGSGDDSPANVGKKMRLMKFAQDRRAQFIKALVLTQWSRQSAEVSKVIDLKVWLDRQRSYYDEAWYWLGDMKRSLAPAKMPNPDLKTALEALSTGKSREYPDLGYIAPKPLTPQEILKALRNINVLLSLRLNLHETIPPTFKNYDIHDGRVTFKIAGEFEIDLSIADEDPKSQFFFIDFRFSFWPSSVEAPSGRIRDEIEAKVNTILQKDGLLGCYKFLHELVLTHKINTLRRQAFDMSRGKWSETLKLELLHRTLVVQYWVGRPGKKNWIELSIVSGDKKDLAGRVIANPISRIVLRGFFQGKEFKELSSNVSLHLHHLNMEHIMEQTMANQISMRLSEIRHGLLQFPLYAQGRLALQQIVAEKPDDCALKIQLTASITVTLKINPQTGRFALQPTWGIFGWVERELNAIQTIGATDAAPTLFRLRCHVTIEEFEGRAVSVGLDRWGEFRIRREDIHRVFPRGSMNFAIFQPMGWKRWVLGMTVSGRGDAWWVIELREEDGSPRRLGGSHQIPIESSTGSIINPTYDFLTRLCTRAAEFVTMFVNARELTQVGIKHTLGNRPSRFHRGGLLRRRRRTRPSLRIPFKDVVLTGRIQKPWAKSSINIACQNISYDFRSVTMSVETQLQRQIPYMGLMESGHDEDVVYNNRSGLLGISIDSRLGQPIVGILKERMYRFQRLFSFLDVLRRYNLAPEMISPGRIMFVYSEQHEYRPQQQQQQQQPRLLAELSFYSGCPLEIRFRRNNPHQRILDFLNKILNDGQGSTGLERTVLLLQITLPLMNVLDEIQEVREDAEDDLEVLVMVRGPGQYQLWYQGHHPCNVTIELRRRRREVMEWYVGLENWPSVAASFPVTLTEGWRRLLEEGSGDGWVGMRTGIVAQVNGIADVIRRINRLMMDHWSVEEAATATTTTTTMMETGGGGGGGAAPVDVITVLD
ncbi:MAG: peptidylprolyl isomerase fpr4 [Watsoniomyces obsoletus]|nr:MAG: peptidylprolyl isomerase fpr4 [Watsoniomyces obsoletus]